MVELNMQWDKWRAIPISQNSVVIDPPAKIDRKFDDLRLEVSGNMLQEDKLLIAEQICDALNATKSGELENG